MLHPVESFQRLRDESAFLVLARAMALQRAGRDIVNLGIGQPDFPTPPHVVEAAVRALREGHHGYTPAPGILPLREAISADLHGRFGVDVSADSILVTPGGKFTIFISILMFGRPGVEIVYPDPSFPTYRSMIEFTGAKAVPLPLRKENGFAFSAADALQVINGCTRLLIVNSPANPTGGITPLDEIERLALGLLNRPDVCVLSDEIYEPFTYGRAARESLLKVPSLRDRLIVLDGASKRYAMTGWRLGWSIWPPALYRLACKLALNSYSCVNAPSQWAGVAALTGPQDAVSEMVAEFDRRRRIVDAGLNAIPGVKSVMPAGAFYAFPDIAASGWDDKSLAAALLEEAGVALVAGSDFGAHGVGHLRVSYANSAGNIERALSQMHDFLAQSRRMPRNSAWEGPHHG